MKALVPAAGKGSRMLGLCQTMPKPLLPVANMPMIGHVLSSLRRAGIEQAAVIVGYMADAVRGYVGDGSQFGMSVSYLEQEAANGTGAAALLGKDFIGDDPFVLAFADIMVHPDFYASFANRLLERDCLALMAVRWVDDPWRGAAVYADADCRVSKVIEKPEPGASTTHYDSAGMFAFRAGIFDQLARLPLSERGEYELTQAIDMAIDEGQGVEVWAIEQYWSNVSNPADLLRINWEVLADRGRESLLDASAVVGACEIGSNVCIGANANVGRGAKLNHCIVMDGASIGAGATLSHAVVRPGAEVEPGAVVAGSADEASIV